MTIKKGMRKWVIKAINMAKKAKKRYKSKKKMIKSIKKDAKKIIS